MKIRYLKSLKTICFCLLEIIISQLKIEKKNCPVTFYTKKGREICYDVAINFAKMNKQKLQFLLKKLYNKTIALCLQMIEKE